MVAPSKSTPKHCTTRLEGGDLSIKDGVIASPLLKGVWGWASLLTIEQMFAGHDQPWHSMVMGFLDDKPAVARPCLMHTFCPRILL